MSELIAGAVGCIFSFVVNYTRSLRDSVVAGRYEWVNDKVVEDQFPPSKGEQGRKKQCFKLFHFKKEIESQEVIREMTMNGYRPATLRELLAFGEVNPNIQRRFPIIALGSVRVSRNHHSVVGLWCDLGGRDV